MAKIKSGCPVNQNMQRFIMNKMYRPLPNCVTIRESPIEGLGLFATERIPAGTYIGIVHVVSENVVGGIQIHQTVLR